MKIDSEQNIDNRWTRFRVCDGFNTDDFSKTFTRTWLLITRGIHPTDASTFVSSVLRFRERTVAGASPHPAVTRSCAGAPRTPRGPTTINWKKKAFNCIIFCVSVLRLRQRLANVERKTSIFHQDLNKVKMGDSSACCNVLRIVIASFKHVFISITNTL